MNKRIIIVVLSALAVFLTSLAWCDTSTNSVPSIKQASKFYILPIQNITGENSNAFQLVVFRSIYNFMRIIPSIDVPDDKVMNGLFWLTSVLPEWSRVNAEYAPKEVYGADYILYGDYEIKQKSPEKVTIKIGVWSKSENKNIFNKSYVTATDEDVFDSIDLILKNIIEDVLKVNYSLARIDLYIRAGSEKYLIYINNQLIDTVDKKDYKKSLSVLGGQSYTISIARLRDGRTVNACTKTLGAKENLAVTYFATGSVVLDPVRYSRKEEIYSYTLDGNPAYENEFISNMNASSNHNIKVTDQRSNLIYEAPFNVMDGVITHVTPTEEWGGPLHLMVYSGNCSFAGLAAEYFPYRYFWLEAGGGVSWYKTIYDVSPYLGIGYYFIGDMKTDFRLGCGITASYYQYVPLSAITPPYNYSGGIFAQFEWKCINLRIGCYYDFGAKQACPDASIGFKI